MGVLHIYKSDPVELADLLVVEADLLTYVALEYLFHRNDLRLHLTCGYADNFDGLSSAMHP
jgi:hypothetical protein